MPHSSCAVAEGNPRRITPHTTFSELRLGSETIVYLKPKAGEDLIVKSMMDSDYSAHINDMKLLSFNEDDIYIFDEETTQLVLKF